MSNDAKPKWFTRKNEIVYFEYNLIQFANRYILYPSLHFIELCTWRSFDTIVAIGRQATNAFHLKHWNPCIWFPASKNCLFGVVFLVHRSLVISKRNWSCVSGYKHKWRRRCCFLRWSEDAQAHTLRVSKRKSWRNKVHSLYVTANVFFNLPDWNAPNNRSKNRKYIVYLIRAM